MTNDTERKKFFEMMRQIHADTDLRRRIVADVRKLAADPTWCAKRAVELRKRHTQMSVHILRTTSS
jgi:hypothetical protein